MGLDLVRAANMIGLGVLLIDTCMASVVGSFGDVGVCKLVSSTRCYSNIRDWRCPVVLVDHNNFAASTQGLAQFILISKSHNTFSSVSVTIALEFPRVSFE